MCFTKELISTFYHLKFSGDEENVEKFSRRLVKVTKEHNEECKTLLRLMGIPYVEVRATVRWK